MVTMIKLSIISSGRNFRITQLENVNEDTFSEGTCNTMESTAMMADKIPGYSKLRTSSNTTAVDTETKKSH